MATLEEIFTAMPDTPAGGTHELLVIDPDTRQIEVPEIESIFGVIRDGNAEKKYFQCPRYVGKGIDLAACKLRIAYQNASGTEEGRDGYLVEDLTESDGYVYFSWELSPKVCLYQGPVQFSVCAMLGDTVAWHTTLAKGTVLEGQEYDGEIVQTEMQDVIAQLLALVEAQSKAVEAVGAAQVQTVQAAAKAAQEAAVAEIEAKKQNTLAQLPADYTAMGSQVDKLTRSTAGAIICETEGEIIQVANASDNFLPGLRIFGRSTQDGTPSPDNPVEIVSTPAPVVRVYGKNLCPDTAFNDMSKNGTANTYDASTHTITMDEDAATHSGRYCAPVKNLIVGEPYTLSFDIRGTSGKIVKCGWDKENIDVTLSNTFERYNVTLNTAIPKEPIIFYSYPAISGGLLAGEFVQFANVQIEAGDAATEYEPYKAAQTLTVANVLPGIPVSSGGNYTDADGQQWICNEVDLGRGVYVQRVGTATFDGTDEYTGGKEIAMSTTVTQVPPTNVRFDFFDNAITNVKMQPTNAQQSVLCNYARPAVKANYDGVWLNETNVFYGRISVPGSIASTVGELRALLQANPIQFAFPLAEPVEIPLSEAELAAFAALHSNKPTTTILNDSGAHMAVEYVADTKLYIDSKLAELVAAMNA